MKNIFTALPKAKFYSHHPKVESGQPYNFKETTLESGNMVKKQIKDSTTLLPKEYIEAWAHRHRKNGILRGLLSRTDVDSNVMKIFERIQHARKKKKGD